jgi:hypothetical protein
MRPARLGILVGTLVGTGALYLKHLAVDGAAFRSLGGGRIPTIWQELGKWGRPGAALLAASLVALAYRSHAGWWDRVGAIAAVALGGAAVAGGVLAMGVAGDDAALVAAALGQGGGGASAGLGFWVVLGGGGIVTAGAVWDLVAAWWGPGKGASAGAGASAGEGDATAVE